MDNKKPTNIAESEFMQSVKKHYHKFKFISPTFIELNGEEFLALHNGQGMFLSTDELKVIVEALQQTIEQPGMDQKLKEISDYISYFSNFHSDPLDSSKYKIPIENLGIQKKEFSPEKNWGFTCGNCSKKVSSKDGGFYFTIVPSYPFDKILQSSWVRACSEGCAYVIAKDVINNWLTFQGKYKDQFNTENLDNRLKQYIDSLD